MRINDDPSIPTSKGGFALGRVSIWIVIAAFYGLIAPHRCPGQLPPVPGKAGPRVPALQSNVAADAAGSAATPQSIEARLAEVRAVLAADAAMGDAALTNAPPGVALQDVSMRRGLMRRLLRLYEQHQNNLGDLASAEARRKELAREAQAWNRFPEPPPYSILLTDGLREELQAEVLKVKNGEAALSVLDRLVGENRGLLAQAEGKIRQFNEQIEGAKDPAATTRLVWQRDLERLQSQVSAASVAVLDSERQVRSEELAGSRIRLALLQRQIVIADAGATFTHAALDQAVARIESERQQLEGELADLLARQGATRQAVEKAREELRQVQTRSDSGQATLARATELVELREAQFDTADTAIDVLRLILEAGNIERTMWELRFAAFDTRNAETLRQSERRLEWFARRLDLWRDYQRQQLDVSSSEIQLQESRASTLAQGSDLLPLIRERLVALRERDQFLLRIYRTIERVERLTQRWGEGIQAASGKLPFTGRVRNLFSDTRSLLSKLWNFELFSAEDTITVDGQKITGKRSVTIGKIVMAIVILVLGFWITGLISRVAEPLIIRRLKIEANQANLIRRWLRALMVVCLVMFSLVSVKIPLTVFAFAGGALAIGLGFGTQTLLKNFVSGLILLFERPFRVGDVLDVGGQRGTVTGIGLRSSVLQLWDGTETLIPNSSLLENNVTNWTYSNRKVRFSVSVGVAYGSDPRRVIQLLTEVAERHGVLEKEPKPQVLFTDFGESALTFELRFWVDVLKANAAQVSSDLRQMIAGTFAEHGIVIAFPQRDIRLDATHPIPVRMMSPPEPPPAT